ncbi:hypothetical protein PoB_002378100 [Plakobranchus ocellatus]|uniref:Uncharacterized protein n=1 Tax=Plakobranchus ocellatus TaxID=259542 RepID=A0AAV3ZMT0_9GAST|nr:hypothetical protein PoB_002378100 [Plakobranchus ocellatus]
MDKRKKSSNSSKVKAIPHTKNNNCRGFFFCLQLSPLGLESIRRPPDIFLILRPPGRLQSVFGGHQRDSRVFLAAALLTLESFWSGHSGVLHRRHIEREVKRESRIA